LYDGHLHISSYSRHIYGHDHLNYARVILGGVDTRKFSPSELPRARRVVYVGRVLPHKGIDVLIEAMPKGVELEIIGQVAEPEYLADLHRLASGKAIRFYHDYDDFKLIQAYRAAACVVLPSVYTTMYGQKDVVPELLGQTLLEAMACGTPVIASDVASLPEIVVEGETGFIAAPNDPLALREKIQWLVVHPGEATIMGVKARRSVLEHFTWPAVVERCLDAYKITSTHQDGPLASGYSC
jgi:glycosyltransferase involved in cell wall biosynthesis